MTKPVEIKVGDRVSIHLSEHPWYWCEGIVTSAVNHKKSWNPLAKDDWYVELDIEKGSGLSLGYGYWKQSVDGGAIKVIAKKVKDD